MTISDTQAFLAAAREDFKTFLALAFKELHPADSFLDNWHIDAIVYRLELSAQGKIRRLIINKPPRQLKSFIVSVAFPAFLMGRDPAVKIICVSYGEDLAAEFGRQTRTLLQSSWYQKMFPHVKLTKAAESDLTTDQGGFRYATTVCGPLTGKGGDFIIVDDPSKPIDMKSGSRQDQTNEWYRNTLITRLNDKRYGVLIVVMQRLHVNDLTGFIEGDGTFHKLSLPAIAEKEETIDIGHGLTHTRRLGEALHEARESVTDLQLLRQSMGSHLFSAQYQQKPQIANGDVFKPKYFNLVKHLPAHTGDGYFCVSIDCAMSQSSQADYTAITLAHITSDRCTLLNVKRKRYNYEEIKNIALTYIEKLGSKLVFVIEAANVGISLIEFLKPHSQHVFFYRPVDSKLGRAAQMLTYFEAGYVQLLNIEGQNSWIEGLLAELCLFPKSRYDDQVDSVVQLVWFAKSRPHPFGRAFTC